MFVQISRHSNAPKMCFRRVQFVVFVLILRFVHLFDVDEVEEIVLICVSCQGKGKRKEVLVS